MLQNAYFLAKIGADTAENEQHFAGNLPKIGKFPANGVHLEAEREDRRQLRRADFVRLPGLALRELLADAEEDLKTRTGFLTDYDSERRKHFVSHLRIRE